MGSEAESLPSLHPSITIEKEELRHEKRRVGGCEEAEKHTTGLALRRQQLYQQDARTVTIKGTFSVWKGQRGTGERS